MQGSSVVASGEDESLLRARSTRMSSTKSPTTKPKSCLAAAGGHHRPHLLAAASHDGIVLAQRQIPNKGSEIHEVAPLVADLDLTGRVVTFDALHTQRATAEHLVGVKNADYLMTVKANQPTCSLPAKPPCPGRRATSAAEHTTRERGHGRTSSVRAYRRVALEFLA